MASEHNIANLNAYMRLTTPNYQSDELYADLSDNDNLIIDNDLPAHENEIAVSKYITENELNDICNFKNHNLLNLMHINARSLNSSYDQLKTILENLNGHFNAIAITETWMKSCFDTDSTHPIRGYELITKSRANKTGGGVGIYLSK